MAKSWMNRPEVDRKHPSVGKKDHATGKIAAGGQMELPLNEHTTEGPKISKLDMKKMETGTA